MLSYSAVRGEQQKNARPNTGGSSCTETERKEKHRQQAAKKSADNKICCAFCGKMQVKQEQMPITGNKCKKCGKDNRLMQNANQEPRTAGYI